MQTIAVQVQDDYVQNFMNYVNNNSENITILEESDNEIELFF
jgi:hypothetical protein